MKPFAKKLAIAVVSVVLVFLIYGELPIHDNSGRVHHTGKAGVIGADSNNPGGSPGNASVSNGQWVNAGQVIWFQYTSQAIGTVTLNQDVRIMLPTGQTNLQDWTISCNLATNGGYGTGYLVPTSGWLQSGTTYSSTGGFPQGSMFVNIYALNSMPTGGGTAGCVNTLAGANIGTLLASMPTGSSYPVSFVGTTAVNASPWSIPGFTNTLTQSNPGAGVDWSSSTFGGSSGGSGGRQCIQSIFFKLVTSATVANRFPGIIFNLASGAQQVAYFPATAQTAGSTQFYSYSPGAVEAVQTVGANTYHVVPFNNGSPICFSAGTGTGTISSVTSGIQSGDQFTNISILAQTQQDNN